MKTSDLENKYCDLCDSIDEDDLQNFYNNYLIEAPDFFVEEGWYSIGNPGDEFYEEGRIESKHIKTTMEFEKLINLLKEAMDVLRCYRRKVIMHERALDGVLEYAENEAKAGQYENIISARALGNAFAINFDSAMRIGCDLMEGFNDRVLYLQHLAPSVSSFQQSPHLVPSYSFETHSQKENTEVKQQKKGRKSEFPALKGKNLLFKNNAEQEKWAELFIAFLKKHKRSNEELSTTAENYINRALFRFIFEWEKNNMLRSERNTQAPSVFLFVSCKLKGIEFRAHANVIEKLSTQCFKEDDKNDDLHLYVAEFICQHKTTTINTTKD
ncbi:MAG: hypothetical protein IKT92_06305 [Bacteroidaceae bacterium]|nr:hypothetical protein [Bacteroidaceae bacterium]